MVGAFIQLALALFFASILSTKMKGAGIFKGLLFFPYLVCGIAVGFIFKFFYTRGFVLDTVLQWIGFELDNLPYWLRDTSINNISLAATSIWRYILVRIWCSLSERSCPWILPCMKRQILMEQALSRNLDM